MRSDCASSGLSSGPPNWSIGRVSTARTIDCQRFAHRRKVALLEVLHRTHLALPILAVGRCPLGRQQRLPLKRFGIAGRNGPDDFRIEVSYRKRQIELPCPAGLTLFTAEFGIDLDESRQLLKLGGGTRPLCGSDRGPLLSERLLDPLLARV